MGSPIVDMLAQVEEEFIQNIAGGKGGMELVGSEEMDQLVEKLDSTVLKACGGSAGNTTFAIARLGIRAKFLGQLGKDREGKFYTDEFAQLGGDISSFKFIDDVYTARCLSMVTPDSERTMRTDLGAAALLNPDAITSADFADIDFVHMEGYLLFNPVLAEKVLQSAKEAGCKVSLDLGSFEVVAAAGEKLESLLDKYVDYVFANEDEARAYTGTDDPQDALKSLGKVCEVVVVKLGGQGLWFSENKQEAVFVAADEAESVIDTTGAGDFWAAGFIWGVLTGKSLEESASVGAVLGCEVVQQLGAGLAEDVWERVIRKIK